MPDRIQYIEDDDRQQEAKQERDDFYKSTRWKKLSKRYLQKNPLCGHCEVTGLLTIAQIVHHRIDRLSRPDLAYTWSNLEGLCRSCHTRHHNVNR